MHWKENCISYDGGWIIFFQLVMCRSHFLQFLVSLNSQSLKNGVPEKCSAQAWSVMILHVQLVTSHIGTYVSGVMSSKPAQLF